jgi:hypothetical protein
VAWGCGAAAGAGWKKPEFLKNLKYSRESQCAHDRAHQIRARARKSIATSLHRYIATSLHLYISTSLHKSLHRYISTYIATSLHRYNIIINHHPSSFSFTPSTPWSPPPRPASVLCRDRQRLHCHCHQQLTPTRCPGRPPTSSHTPKPNH